MTDTPMTPAREQEIRVAVANFSTHPELGFACCSAHAAADAVPELLAEVDRLRARVAELEAATGTARAMHRKHTDSEHCQYDDMTWPCPTVTALGPTDEEGQR